MQPMGVLIRMNGSRLPIMRMGVDGTIEVQGTYVVFETTIRTAIRSGYDLAEAATDLREAWETERARIFPQPGVCHA